MPWANFCDRHSRDHTVIIYMPSIAAVVLLLATSELPVSGVGQLSMLIVTALCSDINMKAFFIFKNTKVLGFEYWYWLLLSEPLINY